MHVYAHTYTYKEIYPNYVIGGALPPSAEVNNPVSPLTKLPALTTLSITHVLRRHTKGATKAHKMYYEECTYLPSGTMVLPRDLTRP